MNSRATTKTAGWTKRLLLVVLVGSFVAVQIGVALRLYPMLPLIGAYAHDLIAPSGGPPVPVTTAKVGGAEPGSLISALTMPSVTRKWEGRGFQAARVVYRSTSGDDNSPTVVSGSVFVPNGAAPDGGWPVVSIGHGTLGIENACAPSLSDTLFGSLVYVKVLTHLGYAVALADFEGLGTKGVHPYTDSTTAGLNMIDAVRAMRRTFPDVSDRWVAVGHSQGGGAAWAADEQAGRYAPELRMLGALAASPGPDLTGLVDKAQHGTLTSQQRAVFLAVVESLARLHPDLARDDFRRGAAAHYWNAVLDCTPDTAYTRASALKQFKAGDFAPRTPKAAARLRDLLAQWALPQRPLSAPLYVWYGGKDPYIDAAWTEAAIRRACTRGGVVTIVFAPEGGHTPADAVQLIEWMADRFEGRPAKNDC